MLPRCHDTDQSFCPECGQPCDEIHGAAFRFLDLMVCEPCGEEALDNDRAAWEEAEDRRRDNALEADYRKMGA